MTRDLLFELAPLFQAEAERAAEGERASLFRVDGGDWFRSHFETGSKPDLAEADRLDTITDELRERAEGRAA